MCCVVKKNWIVKGKRARERVIRAYTKGARIYKSCVVKIMCVEWDKQ